MKVNHEVFGSERNEENTHDKNVKCDVVRITLSNGKKVFISENGNKELLIDSEKGIKCTKTLDKFTPTSPVTQIFSIK